MRIQILILLTSILAVSCQKNEKKNIEKEKISLNGNWEYLGFGKAIVIGDSIVKSFHTSSVGNVQTSTNSTTDFFNYYSVHTISNDTILLKDGVKIFKLYRQNEDFSKKVNEELANDPKYNFEVLWNTFNEQYCYFEERNIDWNSIYKKYEPQVNSNTNPLELYLTFEKMLNEIKDGHISIDLPDELEEDYEKHLINNNDEEAEEDFPDGLEKKVKNLIIEKHLKKVKSFNQGELKWGMVNKDIAYIQTSNMISWANYNISDTLSTKEFWSEWWKNLNQANNYHDDVANGTRFIMDYITNSLVNTKACIIDLRFNSGGFDDVSVEILNHFVNKKTDICTKKVRLGKGFTEKQTMSLIPSENNFKGKLFILTSHETASAAELLVLGSKEIPNSKIIGSTTEGVFSDILHKKLPNGWRYGLSNMIYESLDGVSYEEIGIAPDYELEYPVKSKDFYEYLLSDIKDGDDAIEKVIEEIKAE
ncbi:S41 family peptidase [Flaviramulus sp. BrNp1-15]|uniref:S41 family peptidase n=1 Tax=Flaviramulus sp. BrNp1-15 TaxID=2916754 RepID=UPI001EE9AC2C|nr:S41 family peptidase [Flaviramulus sp. BrNp1-15]ULC58503.1 S41 family peptidase [Flaviramulus sp. BrNp1-15]